MKRRLRTILGWLFILTFLIDFKLWARSECQSDYFDYVTASGKIWRLTDDNGGLQLELIIRADNHDGGFEPGYSAFGGETHKSYVQRGVMPTSLEFLKSMACSWQDAAKDNRGSIRANIFGLLLLSQSGKFWFRGIRIPYYMIAVLSLLYPIGLKIVRLRRSLIMKRRLRNGQCTACGYDLRESADRCPECGQICQLSARGSGSAPG